MTRVRRITTMSRRGWSKKDWRILHDYVSRVVVRRTYVWVRHIQVERGGGGGCQREVVFLDCKMVFLFLNSSVSSWAPIETRHPLLLRSWHYEDNEVGQFFSSSLTFFSYSYSKTHFLKPHFPQQQSVLITMETFSYLVFTAEMSFSFFGNERKHDLSKFEIFRQVEWCDYIYGDDSISACKCWPKCMSVWFYCALVTKEGGNFLGGSSKLVYWHWLSKISFTRWTWRNLYELARTRLNLLNLLKLIFELVKTC